ncbi:MAG: hypothetical protein KA524_11065 [Nitrosomonas sp.]|nr:hypothetical protein [Nitrosomonas sp.]MBP6076944.1 hypothetical protein [Nitrosomonas sp.]
MNMKTITLYTSFLMVLFFSVHTFAAGNHLTEAIQHAEAAVKSAEGKSIAQHAEEAKTHANAAKNEKTQATTSGSHLDAGIRSLDEAIKEGNLGAIDSARKAAEQAITHLKQAA